MVARENLDSQVKDLINKAMNPSTFNGEVVRKNTSFKHGSHPEGAIFVMAVENNSKQPLQLIAEADTDSSGGTPKPEATIGDNYVQDLYNISMSTDLYIPSDRCLETTQIDEEYGDHEEMPEPK